MDNSVQRIRCLVVDDEPLAREVLVRFIGREPSLALTGECGNAVEALSLLRQQPVDLLFLDIQMPELLGTDLIRILRNPPKVILTTAFPEFALEGYELDVVDYLLKPIHFERFLKAVNKVSMVIGGSAEAAAVGATASGTAAGPEAASRAGASTAAASGQSTDRADGWLYFRTDRKMVKVMLEDVLYIEGMKNYIKIITTRGLVITKHSMTAVEAMLPASGFLRTHRSYIVSRSKISAYTGEFVGVGKVEIPIGKLYKNGVMAVLEDRH